MESDRQVTSKEDDNAKMTKDVMSLVMQTEIFKQSQKPQGGNVVYEHPVVKGAFLRMTEEDSSAKWRELLLHPVTLGAFIMAQMDAKNVVTAVFDWFDAKYELATNEQILNQSLYILLSDEEMMDTFKRMANGGVSEYHANLLAMISLRMIEAMDAMFKSMKKKSLEE